MGVCISNVNNSNSRSRVGCSSIPELEFLFALFKLPDSAVFSFDTCPTRCIYEAKYGLCGSFVVCDSVCKDFLAWVQMEPPVTTPKDF
jgi:hypothetical protein